METPLPGRTSKRKRDNKKIRTKTNARIEGSREKRRKKGTRRAVRVRMKQGSGQWFPMGS
jgi:hypothetical protein